MKLLWIGLNWGCCEKLALRELWFLCEKILSKACTSKMCADGPVKGGGLVRRMQGNKCYKYSLCARHCMMDNNHN